MRKLKSLACIIILVSFIGVQSTDKVLAQDSPNCSTFNFPFGDWKISPGLIPDSNGGGNFDWYMTSVAEFAYGLAAPLRETSAVLVWSPGNLDRSTLSKLQAET